MRRKICDDITRINIYISNANVYTQSVFVEYVQECGGIDKLKKKNLDKIIHKFPEATISNGSFMDIYKLACDNESGQVITAWTWIVGITSIISLIVSIIGLAISIINTL